MKPVYKSLLALAAFLSIFFVSLTAKADSPRYTLIPFFRPSANAISINNRGQIIGQVYEGLNSRCYIWDKDKITLLQTLEGNNCFPIDNNDVEQVTGQYEDGSGELRPFLWQAGTMIDLGTLRGRFPMPLAINKLGSIVGIVDLGLSYHGFLWKDGVYTELGALGGYSDELESLAFDINTRGQIVGSSSFGYLNADILHATLWDRGGMTDLGTLGGEMSEARAINKLGQIVGQSMTATGDWHAFLWENGVMIDLGTLGGASSIGFSINDCGQVVGGSTTVSSDRDQAFLWEKGTMIDLGTPAGATASFADDINDFGQIVGQGQFPDDAFSILWQPTGIIKRPCQNR
jgi:probable HAF family extracellular repeat protein